MDLRFENPPAATRGPNSHNEDEIDAAQQLRDNPQQWAVLYEFDATPTHKARAGAISSAIKNGTRRSFGKGYASVTRTVRDEDGSSVIRVYAKFNGDA